MSANWAGAPMAGHRCPESLRAGAELGVTLSSRAPLCLYPRSDRSGSRRCGGAGARPCLSHNLQRGDDDGLLGALDDRLQLVLLGAGHGELVQRLLEIVHEGPPLVIGDHEMPMAVAHRPAGVQLRAASAPADHLGHQELEPGGRDAVVRLVHARVSVQAGGRP